MSERTGICNKCGQRYGDIPDSVTALKVKCQVCDGIVDIPPMPAPAEPAAAEPAPEAPAAAPAAPAEEGDKPLAAPLGGARPKTERPEKAKSIDRDVAAPAPQPAPPAAAPVKPVKPAAKPVKPIKPVAKAKPVTPIKPVAKAKPVKPIKPVAKAKPVAPVKPVAKAPAPAPKKAFEQPAAKAAAPAPEKPAVKPKPKVKAPAPKPVEKAAPAEKPAEKKSSAADIIAKAKAKRATEDKAKPAEKKSSAADIIAKAKAKRAAAEKPAASKPKPKAKPSSKDPFEKSIIGGGARRPSSSGQKRAAANRARRHRDEEDVVEKSKAPLVILCIAALAIVAGGTWYMLKDKDKSVENGETVNVPADETGGNAAANNANNNAPAAVDVAPATPDAVDVAPATSDAVDVVPGSGTDADPAAADVGTDNAGGDTPDELATPAAPAASKPSAEWTVPAAGEAVSVRGVTDHTLIKLDLVPALPKFSGSSDDEWSDIVEDLELFMDDSGAQSNRAGKRLVDDYPRGAFPAIVNGMMKLDYEDSDGQYMASSLNELLTRIGKGTNLGWTSMSDLESGTDEWSSGVLYNKKVAAGWHMMWVNKYGVDDNAWASFSSSAGAAADAAKEAAKKKEEVGGVIAPEDD
ncbi:MAG: hypothetical protein GY747_07010 [Planctomycetes bacterium]|nr:hypothetical protein [Planctomycetota bacterium]